MLFPIIEAVLFLSAFGGSEVAGAGVLAHAHHLEAPLTISLSGPAAVAGAGELELVLRIERHVPDALPMRVRVALPSGVTLLDGEADFTLQDDVSEVISRRLRLHAAAVPKGDLEVVVAARGPSHGVQASASYRFGRAEPVVARAPLGPELRGAGGGRIGRPVRLSPEAIVKRR